MGVLGNKLKHLFLGNDEDEIVQQETYLDTNGCIWFAVIRVEGDNEYFKDFMASYFHEAGFEVVKESKSKLSLSNPKLGTNLSAAFGKNQKQERILQISYEKINEEVETKLRLILAETEVPLYYHKLLEGFGHKLGHCNLLKGQTGKLVEVKRHQSHHFSPSSASVLMNLTDFIKDKTVWDKKQHLWVAYLRSDCPREFIKVLFLNFMEDRNFVISRVQTSFIEAACTALKVNLVMKIGFNQNNEKLLHINYTDKVECFTRTDFFRDFSKELEAYRFFDGQIEPIVKPKLSETATSLYTEPNHSDHPFDYIEAIDFFPTLSSSFNGIPIVQNNLAVSGSFSEPNTPHSSSRSTPVLSRTPSFYSESGSVNSIAPGVALKMQKEIRDQIRKEDIEDQILNEEEQRLKEEEERLKKEEEMLRMAEEQSVKSRPETQI